MSGHVVTCQEVFIAATAVQNAVCLSYNFLIKKQNKLRRLHFYVLVGL